MLEADSESLAQEADRCVSCGLCVPLCPTWQATKNEAHSPRGRIAMMAALATGQAPSSARSYLDACLGCGECERVCPNSVPYTKMLPKAKAGVASQRDFATSCLVALSTSRYRHGLMKLCVALGKAAASVGAGAMLPAAFRRLASIARTVPARRKSARTTAATTEHDADVSLFEGCFEPALDGDGLQAARKLLSACGYRVAKIEGQTCCGALASHAGMLATADGCAERNARALERKARTVAFLSSACAEHFRRNCPDGVQAVEAGALVADRVARLDFGNRRATEVFVHAPCSQRRLPDGGQWVYRLLKDIPGVQARRLPGHGACCGAGGLTQVTHPDIAGKIGEEAIRGMLDAGVRDEAVLATSNYSCGLHLKAAAARLGLRLQVSHPLALAAEMVN